jgi:ATP-binding cassette subfamily F protein 3
LIERVSDFKREKFYAIEEVNYEAEIRKILIGLGLLVKILQVKPEFSGGWRMRIELAKNFAKPDLILLDEPPIMDIESIQWLEDFLINSAKAVVVISHDRIC